MKKIVIIGLFILFQIFGYAQGEWNNWYFGNHAAITFNTAPPTALSNCALGNTMGYPVSVSDSSGNLLFYSDEGTVFNANHTVMPNGSGLYQGLGYQVLFSVKKPGTENIYYLFQVVDFIPNQFFGLFYSIIDMDLDGGLGDIVLGQKNIPFPGMSDAMDLLTATRHKNNNDVWIITKKYLTNQYAAILITDSGISSSIVLSNSNAPVLNVSPGSGELHISSDGQKLICRYYPQNDYAAEFCSFNTETGIVEPQFKLKLFIGLDQGFIGHCGFSPNSKRLYIIGGLPPPSTVGGFFQYDVSIVDSLEILNSKIQVYQSSINPSLTIDPPLQIGPDWKLYFPTWGHDSLHVINYPNILGLGCAVQLNSITLDGNINQCGLPQFLQKYKAYIHYQGTCQNDSIYFAGDIWPPDDTIRWNFGDPASGVANISYDNTPVHVYTSPGQYTVELYVRHIDNRTDTSWKTITINETPDPNLGPDSTFCEGGSVTLNAGFCSGCIYEWASIPSGYSSAQQMVTLNQSGSYYVTVTSTDGCIGHDTIQLMETPGDSVLVSIDVSDESICNGIDVTFTATPVHGGSNPSYQWMVNGVNQGINNAVFSYSPTDSDTVYCILTSSDTVCISNNPATSNPLIMTVYLNLQVSVSLTASDDSVCSGESVIFTATPVNGGVTPSYQWQVNGINTGTNNPGFTYTPNDGDLVICTLTSNAECVTNNPATSNSISMSVGDAPDVSFSVCFDTVTTLNAKPFKLKGGVPLGGIYSGTGVNQITGYFNPAMAGVGLKTISYSYTNLFNCSNNATKAISVINPTPFSCGDSLTDIRDNRKYPTIQLGNQCWLAVNLNHGQQIGGSSAQRDNCLVEKYCYNDLPANCNQYGALYQWDELMRYENTEETQGLCPPGWHVPSEADWNQLFAVYQGNAFAGRPLLYTGYSGFNVLLAGVEFFNQSSRFVDFTTIMWSSTSHGPYKAWSNGLNDYNYSVSYYPSSRSNAFSVRCVQD